MARPGSQAITFFPREHGATAMLLSPFVCAAVLARQFHWIEIFAFLTIALGFAAKDPLVTLFRQRLTWKQPRPETAVARRWLAVELPILLVSGALLLARGPLAAYALLGLGEGAFGALAVWVNVHTKQRAEWFQVMSAIALTATSLLACLAALREIPRWGWQLWTLCALQATAGIFVVHARLDARIAMRGHAPAAEGGAIGNRRAAQLAIAVLVGSAIGAAILGFDWEVPAALLLASCGYTYELRRQKDPISLQMPLTRVGIQALTLSIIYGLLLIAGLW